MAGQWWENDAIAPPTPAAGDWWKQDSLDPSFTKGPVVKPPDDPGVIGGLVNDFNAGVEKGIDYGKRTLDRFLPDAPVDDHVAQGLGYTDAADYTRAQQAQRLAQENRRADANSPAIPAVEQGKQAIADADKDGWYAAAKAIIEHPRAAASISAQSMGMIAPGMAATAAAGPLMPLAVGLNSGITDYQSTLEDQLQRRGVDLTDPVSVKKALDSPEIMAQTQKFAEDHAIPVTLMDTLTAGLAGRMIAGARAPLGAAGRVGAEVAGQMAGGAIGEAGGELNSEGTVSSPSNVLMEAFGEAPTEIVEAPAGYREAKDAAIARERRNAPLVVTPELVQRVHADYHDLADIYGARITSLDRTPEHNREVGGVPNSQHVRHTAGDFVVPERNKASFKAEARARGYQALDEGDHIHLQLPNQHNAVAGAGADRNGRVEPTFSPAQQTDTQAAPAEEMVSQAIEQARSDRGLPLSPPKDDIAAANDQSLPPEERRAAKRRAQGPRLSDPLTGAAEDLLNQVVATAPPIEPPQQLPPEQPVPPAPEPPPPIQPAAEPAAPQQATPPEVAPAPPAEQVAPTEAPAPPEQMQPESQPPAEDYPDEMVGQANDYGGDMPDEASVPEAPQRTTIPITQIDGVGTTGYSEIVRDKMNAEPEFLRLLNDGQPLQQHQVQQVQLPKAQQDKAERLGKLLGRKLVFYDIDSPGGTKIGGFAADDHHIFVNVRAVKSGNVSLAALVGHEFTHTLKNAGNKLIKELIAHAQHQVNTDSSYTQRRLIDYTPVYSRRFNGDPNKLRLAITEELIADMIGDMIADPAFWEDLAATNPSLFKRTIKSFLDFLRGLANKAKRLGQDDAFHDIAELQAKARQLLALHMRDVQKQEKTTQRLSKAKRAKTMLSMGFDDGSNSRRQLRIDAGSLRANQALEKGDYMTAAKTASEVSQSRAPDMPIDTPEKRAFFKDSSRKINPSSDSATVRFHGTARDITTFRPKQADSVFSAGRSEFSARYAAASRGWQEVNGKTDLIIGGKSMREVRASAAPGSVEHALADLLLRAQGDPKLALERLQNYNYVSSGENGIDLEALSPKQMRSVKQRLQALRESDITKGKDEAAPAGMTTIPLVTNASNPFDFQERGHVKRLMEALRDKYRTPAKFVEAMTHKHAFGTWDDVQREIESPESNWTTIEDKGGGIPGLIKELGHDSYFVSEEGHKNLGVFDPKQVKSAYGNAGPFGMRDPTPEEAASLGFTVEEAKAAQDAGDIRLSVLSGEPDEMPPSPSLMSALAQTFTNGLYNDDARKQLERWLLDEYRDVKEIQHVIGQQVFGGRVPQDFDAHGRENLRHGAFQDARERAEQRFIHGIARAVTKVGSDMHEFSKYLWWRHAPERDAYLRSKLDPAIAGGIAPDALAGIDPVVAQQNIAALDPRTRAAFERAAKFVDGMRMFTLKTLLDSGQITQDHYDNLVNQYQQYVPLRGIDDEGERQLNGGKGLSMGKNPIGKRATGRKTEPKNIIEEMMRDMENALIGTQKQRVLSSVVRMIAAYPDPDLWEVRPVTAQRKWVDGVLTVVQTAGEPKDQITFMHRGVPVAIEIRHEGMRKAMLNLQEPVPKWLRSVGRLTRWLSAVKTSLSPFFLLVNPVRDAGMALTGLGAEHGMQALKDMAKFYPHTYKVLGRDREHLKVAPSNDPVVATLQQYAREWASTGGKTGYTYVNDIREQQRKLKHMVDFYADSKGMKDILAGNLTTKDAGLLLRKFGQRVGHSFDLLNDMAENSTRLAVYAAMREKGMSVEDAAKYSKEITVNFNRRGSFGKVLNSFYMFFNASVQGGARVARLTLHNRKFQATMGGVMAASYVLALGQMFGAGDDDDGESLYDKAISDQQAQRSLSFYLGGGKSLNIPVPYGINVFSYLGYRLAKLTYDQSMGKNPSLGKVAGDVLSQALTSMSPLDPGKGFGAFLPEGVRIVYQAQANKSDFGGPIAPKVDPHDRTGNPNFYKTDVKTGDGYRVLAQALNALSGGGDYEGGALNLSGEQARYLTQQVGGGMLTLASQSYELMQNMLSGIDPEPSDIPLANVYLRGKGGKQSEASYYNNLDDYQNTVADWKLAIANNDTSKLDSILARAPWVEGAEADASTTEGRQAQAGSVMAAQRDIEHQIKLLRKDKDTILSDDTLGRREKKQQAYQIDQQIYELEKDFNYAINSGRGYPSTQQ